MLKQLTEGVVQAVVNPSGAMTWAVEFDYTNRSSRAEALCPLEYFAKYERLRDNKRAAAMIAEVQHAH